MTMNGNDNALGLHQSGMNNTITSVQNGNGNATSGYQAGSSNSMTIYQ